VIVKAELHQIPLFVRDGAAAMNAIGDLSREWAESETIAKTPPDLAALDAETRTWFEAR